jgi:hypothetical protein
MKQLKCSFNPEASKVVEEFEQGRKTLLGYANIALFTGKIIEEPTTFEDAWNCEDPTDREKWRNAIKKEFDDMEDKKVWDIISKEDVPGERRYIKCRWIFKVKRNGIFRASLVACGYSQVPGVDFNESYAPVINDVSFRVMLIIKLISGLQASIGDVETAFLHGNIQEEIYMKIPQGMNVKDNSCLPLKRTIDGLVLSARVFYRKLLDILKGLGFVENKSDPCLLSKWEEDEILLVGVYADDCLIIGKQNQIDKLIVELGNGGFNLKVTSSLTDYLSCRVIESDNEIMIAQPNLIKNLSNRVEEEVCQLRVYKTPGTPRFKIVQSCEHFF